MDKAVLSAKNDGDADLLAVRALIAQNNEPELPKPSSPSSQPQEKCALPPDELPARSGRDGKSTRILNFLATTSKTLALGTFARIRAYRPQRGSVVLTSSVLLMILQPAFVFGSMILAVVVALGVYIAMGGDAFWRHIISLYRKVETTYPALARRTKIHTYIFARKWRLFVSRLPGGLGSKLQPPDLRDLMAAEERHDAALRERLSRLN